MKKTRLVVAAAAAAAEEKKASRIVCLDMRQLSSIADLFLICSGNNERQVKAIVQEIEERLSESSLFPFRIEGLPEARWVIMDYGDILIHVFLEEVRSYYELEMLWGDAPDLSIKLKGKGILRSRDT